MTLDLDLRPDLSSIMVVALLLLAVGWAVLFGRPMMALNGPVLAGYGAILMMLSVSLRRWVDG